MAHELAQRDMNTNRLSGSYASLLPQQLLKCNCSRGFLIPVFDYYRAVEVDTMVFPETVPDRPAAGNHYGACRTSVERHHFS